MNRIIPVLNELQIGVLVMSSQLKEQYGEFLNSFNVVVAEDVRSATFFSYGYSQNSDQISAVILEEEQLPNCYTALTEAMLQHINIIIISLCTNGSGLGHNYLHACIAKELNYDVNLKDTIKSIRDVISGPILINYEMQPYTDKNSRVKAVEDIIRQNKATKFLCYENFCDCQQEYENVETFLYKNRYGMISKYLGIIVGSIENYVLLMPADFFEYDLNILNSRYINNRFKVILLREDARQVVRREWIEKNGIMCVEYEEYKKEKIIDFLCSESPGICFLTIKEA